MTTASEEITDSLNPERPAVLTLRLRVFDVALLIMMAMGFLWRAARLDYNTLFVDESVYARVGEAFLVGRDPSNALSYMFGSFFYPVIAAIAIDIGGVMGVRALSVLLSLIAAFFVSLSSRRLLGESGGLWAAFLFLFHGPGISLGQHGVYDALSVALLAAAWYYSLVAVQHNRHTGGFFLLAGVCFALAILAKYIAIVYLPALAAYVLLGRLRRRGRVDVFSRPAWLLALVGAGVVLVPYVYVNLPAILQTLTGQFSSQIVPREQIAQTLLFDSGLIVLLALPGFLLLHRELGRQARSTLQWVLVGVLGLSILVLPIYHLLTSNGRALWKHEVFTLVFLVPVAALALAYLSSSLRRVQTRTQRLLITVILVGSVLCLIGSAFISNRSFHTTWLNFDPAIAHIRGALHLEPDDLVLASAATVYETHLFPDQPDPNGWRDTWGFDYNGVWGEEAMLAAVRDCALAAVILDDYYTPQVNALLTLALASAGYVLDFEDEQVLSSGYTNRITIHVPGATGACAARAT